MRYKLFMGIYSKLRTRKQVNNVLGEIAKQYDLISPDKNYKIEILDSPIVQSWGYKILSEASSNFKKRMAPYLTNCSIIISGDNLVSILKKEKLIPIIGGKTKQLAIVSYKSS